MIPSQLEHPALSSLALLQPLMRLITIYHEPGVCLIWFSAHIAKPKR